MHDLEAAARSCRRRGGWQCQPVQHAQQNGLRQQHTRATTQMMRTRMQARVSLALTHQTSLTMNIFKSTDLAIIRTVLAMEYSYTAVTKITHGFPFHESRYHILAKILD